MILQKTSDLNYIPKRIISLVPSQTELLHYLGLENEIVGITKFCVHPGHWFKTKTKVGGTKATSYNTIHDLKPDLIIANKEENIKEQLFLRQMIKSILAQYQKNDLLTKDNYDPG